MGWQPRWFGSVGVIAVGLALAPALVGQNAGAPTGVRPPAEHAGQPQTGQAGQGAADERRQAREKELERHPAGGIEQQPVPRPPVPGHGPPAVPVHTEEGTLEGSSFRIDVPEAVPGAGSAAVSGAVLGGATEAAAGAVAGAGGEAGSRAVLGREAGASARAGADLAAGGGLGPVAVGWNQSGWNHKLVVYFHGYQSEPQLFRDNPATGEPNAPSRQVRELLRRGYAVAQPGYSAGGWAIAAAEGDGEALRRYFGRHYGAPRQTFVVGQSMGGLLAVVTLEQRAKAYAGGLVLCGVLTPADLIMQRAFANRVAFDAFFPGVLPDVEHIPMQFRINDAGTAALVQKALDGKPAEAALLRSLADIHTNRGLADVLVFNTFVIKDLREKAGGNPFDNRNLIYTGTTDDNALNAKVRRYAADPAAMRYVATYATPTGALRRPLLALHTTYDPLVPASTAGYYAEVTERLGHGDNFVQQYVDRDGHCNIAPEQVGLAFDELVRWVDDHERPTPGRLPGDAGQQPVHQLPAELPAQPKNIGRPQ